MGRLRSLPSGLVTIAKKEFSERLRSKRFFIVIILFVALWAFISIDRLPEVFSLSFDQSAQVLNPGERI